IYEAQAQTSDQVSNIVIRSAGDPSALAASARAVVRETRPKAIISAVSTMEQVLEGHQSRRRVQTWLIATFSALALGLAALGVFALMHYWVASKTKEIGIRTAVGARPLDVFRLVVADGARHAAAGIAIGAVAAVWATQAIASMLYAVNPGDPVSFLIAAI